MAKPQASAMAHPFFDYLDAPRPFDICLTTLCSYCAEDVRVIVDLHYEEEGRGVEITLKDLLQASLEGCVICTQALRQAKIRFPGLFSNEPVDSPAKGSSRDARDFSTQYCARRASSYEERGLGDEVGFVMFALHGRGTVQMPLFRAPTLRHFTRNPTELTSHGIYHALTEQVKRWNVSSITSECAELSWHPTRLVQIERSDDITNIRVVDTKSWTGGQVEYVSLSHRWIREDFLKLVHSTFHDLQLGIPISRLTCNFQDAIQLTYDLGIKYIWIDSLCIIQDDPEDWNREARAMADVYSYARLTLAFNVGINSGGWPIKNSLQSLYNNIQMSKHDLVLESESDAEAYIDTDILATRGWCYQERRLSRNILHVFPHQVVWEKYSDSAYHSYATPLRPTIGTFSEDNTYRKNGARSYRDRVLFSRTSSFSTSDVGKKGPEIGYLVEAAWTDCIMEYTKRHLTQSDDRLSAFLAISTSFEKFFIWTEYMGSLSGALVASLEWYVSSRRDQTGDHQQPPSDHGLSRRTAFRGSGRAVPSWSWASIDGPVMFPTVPESETSTLASFEFLDHNHNDPNSAKVIVAYGIGRPVQMSREATQWQLKCDIHIHILGRGDFSSGTGKRDMENEALSSSSREQIRLLSDLPLTEYFDPKGSIILALRSCKLYSFFGPDTLRWHGLLLKPSKHSETMYERVGWVEQHVDIPENQGLRVSVNSNKIKLERRNLEGGAEFLLI